jgi:mannose-6-phosphate isomerase-like protein (cupin superfamily)
VTLIGGRRTPAHPVWTRCAKNLRMSRHAHINLLELKDVVDGRVEGLEGRFGRDAMGARDIGVSHWRYGPNVQNPMGHKHREQEEAYLVIGGSGRMLLDDEVVELRQWDLVRVSPEVVRSFASGPDGLEIVAVGGPKPEGGDGEAAPVTWPDSA